MLVVFRRVGGRLTPARLRGQSDTEIVCKVWDGAKGGPLLEKQTGSVACKSFSLCDTTSALTQGPRLTGWEQVAVSGFTFRRKCRSNSRASRLDIVEGHAQTAKASLAGSSKAANDFAPCSNVQGGRESRDQVAAQPSDQDAAQLQRHSNQLDMQKAASPAQPQTDAKALYEPGHQCPQSLVIPELTEEQAAAASEKLLGQIPAQSAGVERLVKLCELLVQVRCHALQILLL